MLPVPASPAASWPRFRHAVSSLASNGDVRVRLAFFLFGLINNVLYVIILSAAWDLVGSDIPKGVVLLADVVPSFVVKLVAPYFIHVIPYGTRMWIFMALSTIGMLVIALTQTSIPIRLCGVALASLSSGGGELSFLGLTHYYGQWSLAAWSSGTGAAGLIGAGAYVVATSAIGLSSRTSLLAFAVLPIVSLVAFFVILPRAAIGNISLARWAYEQLPRDDDVDSVDENPDEPPLLIPDAVPKPAKGIVAGLKQNFRRSRGLFIPFMLPLMLVYVAEYCINQGVSPTLLFPISSTPFSEYRDFYPTYNAIYQAGVLISRSSSPFLRIQNLYLPSILQIVNLALLTGQAMFNFIPSIWIVFLVIFWEGLLGGLVYVNTFAKIIDTVALEDREFALGATTVSDSGGICIAGILSMSFETLLCKWQINHGNDLCRQT